MRCSQFTPVGVTLISLVLGACSATPAAPATSDVPAVRDVSSPPADAGNEFANAPTCDVSGFMRLNGAVYMGETIPGSLIMAGRPSLTNAAGPSFVTLNNPAGSAALFRFEWTGMLRADQAADLSGAQIYLPMDQGSASPPLTGPWADRRVCAGAGSRIVLRSTGMQFILRNATVTSGACPGGESLGGDTIMGCYSPNIAP